MSHRPLTRPEADTFLTMRAEALRWNGTKRGEWIERHERHERRRMEIEVDIPAASSVGTALRSSSLQFNHHQPANGVTPMKQPKLHTGLYSCLECCIEFDLTAEESLKCNRCGGQLMKGSLDDFDEEENDEDEGG